MRYFNALNQLSPRPPTPKLATISLPDDSDTESRRTTGISSSGLPSSQGWWANKLGSHRAMREDIGRSNSTTATQVSSRNYENVGPPAIRTHSLSGRNATDRRMASVNGGKVPAAPFGSYRGVYRPLAMDGSLSRTPAPYVPNPSSIEGSSRTRSYSLSQAASTHPEVPTQFPSSRAAVPMRPSNLGNSQRTRTIHRTAPLKEESISLSWPLIKFDANRKRKEYPLLYFDVGFDPKQPKNLMGKVDDHRGFVPLADASRNLPVSTHCSLTEMTIECPHIGQIVVKRSQGIRCIDVYRAIYHEYRERLRAHEIPENLARYSRSFEQRCLDSHAYDVERQAGMRRVDLLRGKRIFDGLTRSGADWELHIHYPE